MKHSVKVIIGMALLGLSTTAFALPPNPYGDVSLNDWEYAAVDQLKKDGIIDKYADTFSLDKASTREEMARMVARAVWNKDKASDGDKVLIHKLSQEFSSELTMIGVYVEGINDKGVPAGQAAAAAGPAKKHFLDKLDIHVFEGRVPGQLLVYGDGQGAERRYIVIDDELVFRIDRFDEAARVDGQVGQGG